MRLLKKTMLLIASTLFVHAQPLGLPPVPIPTDNPQTDNKIKLGDILFHDARFSADGKVSCATCHAKEKAFTDHLPVSKGFSDKKGTRMGTRNAPTVINAAYYTSQFWDGRVPSLEEQSKFPPINPVEGGLHSWDHLVDMLKKDDFYKKEISKVFNIKPSEITIEHLQKLSQALKGLSFQGIQNLTVICMVEKKML